MNDNWRERISLIGVVAISIIVVMADSVITFMLFTYKVPAESKDLANTMFGGFNLALGMIIQYWIGSSRSSSTKDAIISDAAKAAAAKTP